MSAGLMAALANIGPQAAIDTTQACHHCFNGQTMYPLITRPPGNTSIISCFRRDVVFVWKLLKLINFKTKMMPLCTAETRDFSKGEINGEAPLVQF